MNKAAFLDRDGTLIKDVPYLNDPEKIEILPGVVDALKNLTARGYLLIIVTNQSGIGRGLITKQQYQAVTDRLLDLLVMQGVYITGVYHCPHRPEIDCACRKPKTKLFQRAADDFMLDLTKSVMFGDQMSDYIPGLEYCIKVPKDGSWAAWYPTPLPGG